MGIEEMVYDINSSNFRSIRDHMQLYPLSQPYATGKNVDQ